MCVWTAVSLAAYLSASSRSFVLILLYCCTKALIPQVQLLLVFSYTVWFSICTLRRLSLAPLLTSFHFTSPVGNTPYLFRAMFATPHLRAVFTTPHLRAMFATPHLCAVFATPHLRAVFATPHLRAVFATPHLRADRWM